MKRLILIFASFLVGMYSCNTQDKGDSGDGFVYKINIDNAPKAKAHPLSDFCNDVTTIILETTHESLLTKIDKVIHANDRLYVLDRAYKGVGTIAEFDMDGRFIKRYGGVGRGSGEYIGVFNFTVDEQNGLMHLFDHSTNRVISYELESGRYVNDTRFEQTTMSIGSSIISIGDLIYADLDYRTFDESNYMLKSWNRADPAIENHYLPVGVYLKGWDDVSVASNNSFIFNVGNDYALFSNKFSPNVFKVTADGISNYIHIESKNFIDRKGRQIVAEAIEKNNSTAYLTALQNLNRFNGIRYYFETERYICFWIGRGSSLYMFMYDKNSEEIKSGYFNYDPVVVVKSDNGHLAAQSILRPMQASAEGLFYNVPSQMIPRLRTAAQEGMLVDDLDRLEELKQLPDDSNPVIFYMKFKEPMQ